MTSYSGVADAAQDAVWSLPRALSRFQPEACGLLVALNERTWQVSDAVLLELVRVRAAQLIGNPAAVRVRCPYADANAIPESKTAPSPATRARRCSRRPSGTPSPLPSNSSSTSAGPPRPPAPGSSVISAQTAPRGPGVGHLCVEFTQRLQMIAVRLLDDAEPPLIGSPAASEATPAICLRRTRRRSYAGARLIR